MMNLSRKLFCMAVLLTPWGALLHAHGDEHDGHAHATPASVSQTARAVPTLRTETEQFELVARLYPDELGLYLDHWASNEPLLQATVEVEYNGLKAPAVFHADHGDYAVTDAALLKALQAAGEHALVFSVVAGPAADLLTGTLQVTPDDPLQVLSAGVWRWLVGGLLVALLILAAGRYYWQRRRRGELA